MQCWFCNPESTMQYITELETELFKAAWDTNPVTPGHALVIPKRHAQFMHDLNQEEQQTLLSAVIAAKAYISKVDLQQLYQDMHPAFVGTKSEEFIAKALEQLRQFGGQKPDSFNDGLNDGPAAGQTVPHFHWHIMPRWHGDTADPRGGIRHMFAGMGNYHNGVQK